MQHVNRTQHRERSRIRKQDTSAGVGNLLRAGQDRRQPPYFHQGGAHARRFARPRTAARPPGLGKTTLANIIANEMHAQLRVTSGPVLDKPGDLAGLLTNLNPGDVLFIDEIHRLSPIVEEYLYSAMEDYKIDIVLDKGPFGTFDPDRAGAFHADRRHDPQRAAHIAPARALRHPVPSGILRRPGTGRHRQAFGTHPRRLDRRRCGARGGPALARHAPHRQRPAAPRARLRNGQGRRAHRPGNHQNRAFGAQHRLARPRPDGQQDTRHHHRKSSAGPRRVNTIATAVGEDAGTIEEVYEPFLIKEGFLKRTPRGREATELALPALGVTPPGNPRNPAVLRHPPEPAGSRHRRTPRFRTRHF